MSAKEELLKDFELTLYDFWGEKNKTSLSWGLEGFSRQFERFWRAYP